MNVCAQVVQHQHLVPGGGGRIEDVSSDESGTAGEKDAHRRPQLASGSTMVKAQPPSVF